MNGETLPDIVAAYCRVTSTTEKRALRDDIERFLAAAGSDVDARLATTFDLDIIPAAFAADGEDFLRSIGRLLDVA